MMMRALKFQALFDMSRMSMDVTHFLKFPVLTRHVWSFQKIPFLKFGGVSETKSVGKFPRNLKQETCWRFKSKKPVEKTGKPQKNPMMYTCALLRGKISLFLHLRENGNICSEWRLGRRRSRADERVIPARRRCEDTQRRRAGCRRWRV